jgi:hypothetical protein
MSTDPITDLQHEWIAIARGLDDHTSPEGWLSTLEGEMLENEHQGAIFVQKQMLKFLQLQKDQLRRQAASSSTQ